MDNGETISKTKTELRREKILNGNLWKVIFSLTLPLFIFAIFNYVGDLFEMIIANQIGTSEFASVVVIDQIRQAIAAFGTGIAAAGIVVVGKHYGAGQDEKARQSAANAIILAFVVSLVTLGIMLLSGRHLMALLKTPQEMIDLSIGYFYVQMISTALIAINTVFLGLEKSKGNTVFILVVNLIAMIIRVGLSAIFVLVLQRGMVFMAISTLIAQGFILIVGIFVMLNKKNPFQLKLRQFKFSKECIIPILAVGLPIFGGRFLFNIGKVIVNSLAMSYGAEAVGALGIALKVIGGAALIASMLEETETAVVAQNLGNKNLNRAYKSLGVTLVYSAITATITISIVVLLRGQIIMLLEGKASKEYLDMIKFYMFTEVFSAFFAEIGTVFSGFYNGFSKSKLTFLLNIFRLYVFRIPFILILKAIGVDFKTLGYAMAFSNFGTMVVAIIIFIFFHNSVKKYGYGEMTLAIKK